MHTIIVIFIVWWMINIFRSWRRRVAADRYMAKRFVSRDPAVRFAPMDRTGRDALVQASRDAREAYETRTERRRIARMRRLSGHDLGEYAPWAN